MKVSKEIPFTTQILRLMDEYDLSSRSNRMSCANNINGLLSDILQEGANELSEHALEMKNVLQEVIGLQKAIFDDPDIGKDECYYSYTETAEKAIELNDENKLLKSENKRIGELSKKMAYFIGELHRMNVGLSENFNEMEEEILKSKLPVNKEE